MYGVYTVQVAIIRMNLPPLSTKSSNLYMYELITELNAPGCWLGMMIKS